MVIGGGLIAKNMSSFVNNNDIVIFASGVSNSKETNKFEYQREIDLLTSFFGTKKKFIYFSTCSILYDCIEKTNYIDHKKNIENIISANFENYLIFRLPNVVGITKNLNTSFNYFKQKLISGGLINVERHATRYFIDIIDVVESISPIILDKKSNNKTINVCFNNKINILDFINTMSKYMNLEPKIILEDKGCSFDIDNKEFINKVCKKYTSIGNDYNLNLIKKYC
jgi:nucleoside-diphosphate-sugar epimerase